MHKSLGTLVVVAALATVMGGVIVTGKQHESRTTATGAELRRSAAVAIKIAGGKWATLGPGPERGTWKATVVRDDFSTAVVILNDRLQVIRVIGVRPVRRTPAVGRSFAAAQAPDAALNF
jgi:hypothetical protein